MLFEVVQVLMSPMGGTGGPKSLPQRMSTVPLAVSPVAPRDLSEIRSLSQMVGVATSCERHGM